MGILDKIFKSVEKGKLEARQEAADRQATKETRREAFNKAMDHYDAKEDRHLDLAQKSRDAGDISGYEDHMKKADRARKSRNAYPDPD